MNIMARRVMAAGLIAGLLLSTLTAHAGKSSGSGSRSFSSSSTKGSAVRNSPRPSTSGPVTYKSAVPVTPVNRYNSRTPEKTGNYRSVLSQSQTLPSEKLQTVIREKERSGPGWMGTALLVWLLSQHDLSSSDKEWVNQQIAQAKKENQQIPPPPPELSDVAFNWSYPSAFTPGEKALIAVSATQGIAGKSVPVTCVMNGSYGVKDGEITRMEWTPDKAMTSVMRCEAGGLSDLRMFSAGDMK
ncbi:TPA: hypothetical protein ACJIWA_004118 [Enterobacter bugandensis]|uniref:hypothetical protein n=1 Tax=Enterobacter asburiae TaxID=61645 RepID=UPI002002BD7D|nr:hypothetical protein [Enterobacter asburiae]MCK6659451.1 hypothetical protein [Enterobacter asburiae]